MGKSKHPPKGKGQDNSFEAVAKRLGADESVERFERALGKIAKAKPKAKKPRAQ